MARIKLTAGRVRGFSTDKAQAFLWDTEAPGLAVRATANGSRAFIFQGRLSGKDLRVTIGDVGTWGIDAARVEARRLGSLIDRGLDPREIERERRAAVVVEKEAQRRRDVLVGEAWTTYLEERRSKWGAVHLKNQLNMAKAGGEPRTRGRRKGEPAVTMPGPLYPLLSRRLAELDAKAIKAWLAPLAARTPTQAAQTFRALRAFLGWCAEHKEYGPVTHADACKSKVVKETVPTVGTKDGDCLQREQLRPWFEAVGRIGNLVIAVYLQTMLLTGARREELAGLTWDGVDFQWNSLTIHDKVEGERTIPLTPYVAALLARLPRRNAWVFSSPTAADGRLQEPRKAHEKALEAAGLPHVSIHGLRRSFGTLAEWVECPVGIVAQIMGHKPSALAEKHYRRRPLDLLRMWHTKIEAWMLEQAGIQQPQAEEAAQGLRLVSGR